MQYPADFDNHALRGSWHDSDNRMADQEGIPSEGNRQKFITALQEHHRRVSRRLAHETGNTTANLSAADPKVAAKKFNDFLGADLEKTPTTL